ncbi:hypothetical protein GCM10017673_20760 [Streptosporangium violaceochromogenes]|nr:hypothetical protein GCM10017673_20760 [Streptosporangium violaceochromogenes]
MTAEAVPGDTRVEGEGEDGLLQGRRGGTLMIAGVPCRGNGFSPPPSVPLTRALSPVPLRLVPSSAALRPRPGGEGGGRGAGGGAGGPEKRTKEGGWPYLAA